MSYKTDWKFNPYFTSLERVEALSRKNGNLRIRHVTQSLADYILHSVASFLSNRPLKESNTHVLELKNLTLTNDPKQQEVLARILSQKDKALPTIKQELYEQLKLFIKDTLPTSPSLPSPPVKPLPLASIPKKPNVKISHTSSKKPISEQVEAIKAELSDLFEQKPEAIAWSTPWIGKLYETSHAFACWLFPKLPEWEKQIAHSLALPLPCPEEDVRDRELLERCAEPAKQLSAKLQQLMKHVPSGELLTECQTLSARLSKAITRMAWLQTYFEESERLETALDKTGEQILALNEGKMDFSADSYRALVKQITCLEQLKQVMSTSPDTIWRERIERKCCYQISQAQNHLEDLMPELMAEVKAEIIETHAHLEACQKRLANAKPVTFLEDLRYLYEAHLGYQKIKKDCLQISLAFTEIAKNPFALSKESSSQLETDHHTIKQLLQDLPRDFPSKKSFKHFEVVLKERQDAKEYLTSLVSSLSAAQSSPDPHKVRIATCSLAALEFFEKNVSNFLSPLPDYLIGLQKALSSHPHKGDPDKMLEEIYIRRKVLSPAKQQQILWQKESSSSEEYSPAKQKALRFFFAYLQVWDLFSPILGTLINPIGKRDYNFYVSMMSKAYKEKNPSDYEHYFKMAYRIAGSDQQEFLTMYDRYLKGEIQFGFKKSEPSETPPASWLEAFDPLLPETIKTWFTKFLGTCPDESPLINASEWEKWAYHHIYPRMREQAFDQLLESFIHTETSPEGLSKEIAPADTLKHHYHKLFKSAKKIYAGSEKTAHKEYLQFLTDAKEQLPHAAHFIKEYDTHLHAFLESHKLFLENQPVSIPTLTLGKAILQRLNKDVNSELQGLTQRLDTVPSGDYLEAIKNHHGSLNAHQTDLQALQEKAPFEYATKPVITAWLRQLEALRRRYVDDRLETRSTIFNEEWKEFISLEKLKLFLDTPSTGIDAMILAQAAGSTFLYGTPYHPDDLFKTFEYRLNLLKQRIAILKDNPLCTESKTAGFCEEYLKNPTFAKKIGQSSVLAFLENLESQLQQSQKLSELFDEKTINVFSENLHTSLKALKPGESLFFPHMPSKMTLEIIAQPHGTFSLRLYDAAKPQDHLRHIEQGKERALPFTAIVNIPLSALQQQNLWADIRSTTNASPEWQASLAVRLGGIFELENSSEEFLDVAQHGAYQTLSTVLFRQFPQKNNFYRFEFESLFKALRDFHLTYQNTYISQETDLNLMHVSSQNFAARLPGWHKNKIINDEELHFARQFIEKVQTDLAQAKAIVPSQTSQTVLNLNEKLSPLTLDPADFNLLTFDKLSQESPLGKTLLEPVKPYQPISFIKPTQDNFKASLTSFIDQVENQPAERVVIAVEKYIEVIDLNNNEFWDRLKDNPRELLNLFIKLNYIFLNKLHEANTDKFMPEDYLAQKKFLAILNELFNLAFPNNTFLLIPSEKLKLDYRLSSEWENNPQFKEIETYRHSKKNVHTHSFWQWRVSLSFPEDAIRKEISSKFPQFVPYLENENKEKIFQAYLNTNGYLLTVDETTEIKVTKGLSHTYFPPEGYKFFPLVISLGKTLSKLDTQGLILDSKITISDGHIKFDVENNQNVPTDPNWESRVNNTFVESFEFEGLLADNQKTRIRIPPNQIAAKVETIAKSLSLSPHHAADLLLLSSVPELQIVSTLSYFSENIGLLGQAKYRQLFKYLLFESNLLGDEFAAQIKYQDDNASFANKLGLFCQKALAFYSEIKDQEAISFILEISLLLKMKIDQIGANDAGNLLPLNFKSNIPDARADWETRLKQKDLSPETKGLFYRDLALSYFPESFINRIKSSQDVITLISAYIQQGLYPLPEAAKSSFSNMKMKRLLCLKEKLLYAFLSGPEKQTILNGIYRNLHPEASPIQWQGSFPKYRSENGLIEIDVLQGRLFENHGELSLLPKNIQDSIRQKINQDIPFATLLPTPEGTSSSVYLAIGSHGEKYRFISTPYKNLVIHREFEGRWYQNKPSYTGITKPFPHALNENYDQWYSLDPFSVIYTEKKLGTPAFTTRTLNGKSIISDLKTGHIVVDSFLPSSLTDTLSKIEYPSYFVVLQDPMTEQISNIKITSYNFDFQLQEKEGKKIALCPQLDDYYLAENQKVTGTPLLEKLSNYVVLKKQKPDGEFSTLIVFAFASYNRDGHSSSLSTELTIKAAPYNEVSIFEISPSSGLLIPKSIKDSFNLALYLLWKQEYLEAYKLLDLHFSQTLPLCRISSYILDSITKLKSYNRDNHPQANAIRLKAYSLILQDQETFPHWEPHLYKKKEILESYIEYLQNREWTPLVPLREEEEKLIIKNCLNEIDSTVKINHHLVLQRMQELKMPISSVLEEMAKFEAKSPPPVSFHKPLSFSQIKNELLLAKDSFLKKEEFQEQYKFIQNIHKGCPWEKLRDFTLSLAGESQGIFTNFMPTGRMLNKLQKTLQNLQDKSESQSQKLAYFLLETVLLHPKIFPPALDSNLLEGYLSEEKFQASIINPWRKLIRQDPQLQGRVHGLPRPKKEKTAIDIAKESPFDKSVHLFRSSEFWPVALPMTPQDYLIGAGTHNNSVAALRELQSLCHLNLNDNIAQRSLNSLAEHLPSFATKLPLDYSIKDITHFRKALEAFETECQKSQEQLGSLETSILELANKPAKDKVQASLDKALLLAGQTTPLTLDDLIHLFIKREAFSLHARNAHLRFDEMGILYNKIKDYLVLATHKKQVSYLLQLMQQIDKSFTGLTTNTFIQDSLNLLAEEGGRQREYDVHVHPEYLVLEYFSGILLYKIQVDALNDLHIKNGVITQPQNIGKAIELIMGKGKTSVIIPLLSLFNADGNNLAMAVMPKTLLKDVGKVLNKQMWGTFKQAVELLVFPHDQVFDLPMLETLLERLKNVRQHKKVLLTSNDTIQGLFLRMAECFNAYNEANKEGKNLTTLSKELGTFLEIFSLFKESGNLILDEMDFILDVLKSFHLANGVPKKLYEVSPILLQTSQDLITFLALSPELKSALTFTTPEHYNKIKPKIIEAILKGPFETDGGLWHQFLEKMSQKQKKLIHGFLEGSSDTGVLDFTASLNPPLQDILAVLREELNVLLPLITSKNLFEHFGPSLERLLKGNFLAIPYRLGRPEPEGTEFGTELEVIIYTLLMYFEMGIPLNVLKPLIEKLREDFNKERQAQSNTQNPLELESYQFFQMLIDNNPKFQLFSLSEDDYVEIRDIIKKDKKKIFSFVAKYVLPQIEVFQKQLNADGQLFGFLFKQVQGMSGTLWNADTFPAIFSSKADSDTAIKTLFLLLKNSKNKEHISSIQQNVSLENIQNVLAELLANNKSLTSIIDAANVFRGTPNEIVAKNLLEFHQTKNPNIKGALFYQNDDLKIISHTNGEWLIQDFNPQSYDKELLIAYLDQSHTMGSDLQLGIEAHAVVTIGKHTFLRDLLQAVWRLRGLDKSQTVSFFIKEEDRPIIEATLERFGHKPKNHLTLKDLILFTILQQATRQGSDNYRAFQQKIQAFLLEKAITTMLNAETPAQAAEVYIACKDLFETNSLTRPYEMYVRPTKKMGKTEIKEAEIKRVLDSPAMEAFRTHPLLKSKWNEQEIKKQLEELAEKELLKLPDTIIFEENYNRERTMQVQKEAQKQTTKQIKVEREYTDNKNFNVKQGEYDESPVYDWETKNIFTKANFEYYPLTSIFSENILCSRNMCVKDADGDKSRFWLYLTGKKVNPIYASFEENGKPVNFILVLEDKETKNLQAILLDHNDAKQWKHLLEEDRYDRIGFLDHPKKRELRIALYEMNSGVYAHGANEERIDWKAMEANPMFKKLLVQIKWIRGNIHYSLEELEILEKLLLEMGSARRESEISEWQNSIQKRNNINLKDLMKSNLGKLFTKFEQQQALKLPTTDQINMA